MGLPLVLLLVLAARASGAKEPSCLVQTSGVLRNLASSLLPGARGDRTARLAVEDVLQHARESRLDESVVLALGARARSFAGAVSPGDWKDFANFLAALGSNAERLEAVRLMDESMDVVRRTERILSEGLADNRHGAILTYARERGLGAGLVMNMERQLAGLPDERRFSLDDGVHLVDYLASLGSTAQLRTVQDMRQLVEGEVRSRFIRDYLELRGKAMLEYADAHERARREIEASRRMPRSLLGRLVGRRDEGRLRLLETSPRRETLEPYVRLRAEEIMAHHRRAVFECRDRAKWKEAGNLKSAAKGRYVRTMAFVKSSSSAPAFAWYNHGRPAVELISQFSIEFVFKWMSAHVSSKIFASGVRSSKAKASPATWGSQFKNGGAWGLARHGAGRTKDFVFEKKGAFFQLYGFGRVWGVLTAVALNHLLFNTLYGQEEDALYDRIAGDPEANRALVRELVAAMDDDGLQERFTEEFFSWIKGGDGRLVAEAAGADWSTLSKEDLADENVRRVLRKAIEERVYDQKTSENPGWIATGNRAVDYWTFNALYAIPMVGFEYLFNSYLYNIVCRGTREPGVAASKMWGLYMSKKIFLDFALFYPVRHAVIGL